MCTIWVPGLHRGQRGCQIPWTGALGGLNHFSSSQDPFFQVDFPSLKSELASRPALTDRLWERGHSASPGDLWILPSRGRILPWKSKTSTVWQSPQRKDPEEAEAQSSFVTQMMTVNLPSECSHESTEKWQKIYPKNPQSNGKCCKHAPLDDVSVSKRHIWCGLTRFHHPGS